MCWFFGLALSRCSRAVILMLVLVVNNYSSKVGTLHYPEHCFVIKRYFLLMNGGKKNTSWTHLKAAGYRWKPACGRVEIFGVKRKTSTARSIQEARSPVSQDNSWRYPLYCMKNEGVILQQNSS